MTTTHNILAFLLLALALLAPQAGDAANFLYPVTQPFKLYTDANGGPLNNGYIYFGQPNQNPESTPIQMYWDAAGTIPAAQPIRTVNGYISRNGIGPANIFATGDFSITVKNSRGALVFTNPTSTDLQLALAITSIGTAAAIPLVDAGGYFVTKNVEAAFQQLAGPGSVALTNLAAPVQALLVPTGTVLPFVGTAAPTGFVLGSGRTIGSVASGATERANADTSALYTLLWNAMGNTQLPIQDSTGTPTTRGASASNDFSANKRLPLPDLRDRVIAGLGNMGGSDAARLTSGGSGIDGTVMGNAGGSEVHTLSPSEIPAHNHTINITDPGHTHTQAAHSHTATDSGHTHAYFKPGTTVSVRNDANQVNVGGVATSDTTVSGNAIISVGNTTATNASATTGITAASTNTGGGTAHTVTQPTFVMSMIIKL